ncbi:uncharacterized protein BDV17DRAFT_272388 [Aspergillus undulatus]|uniref:uncharacterized protein n=1 Tax=Aspergillus undulatus TaxID=1810928 RepID=UPI003CCDA338
MHQLVVIGIFAVCCGITMALSFNIFNRRRRLNVGIRLPRYLLLSITNITIHIGVSS